MKLIQALYDHKAEVMAAIGTAHIAFIHGYEWVTAHGGVRKIWSDFMGPKPVAPISTTVNQNKIP